ncbi:MAG: hypothetical protein U9R53_11105 [Chloroflexota bacterium]|nr:hypothetical protein [Chloroflexota bacterium]
MTNSNNIERSAYDLLIALVREHGGSMEFAKEGHSTGGTWIIEVAGLKNYFTCYKHSFHGLDELYVPKLGLKPKTFNDYEHELIPDAWEKLIVNMKTDWFECLDDLEWEEQKQKRKDIK